MVQIEFDYKQMKTVIQGNLNDNFQTVIDKYVSKTELNPELIYFSANGTKINPKETVESKMNFVNKDNNIIHVLVDLINVDEKKPVISKSKDIICPKCYEPCKFEIKNYKIKLYDCVNNHIIDNIKLIDFQRTQQINLSDIICNQCKSNNKGYSHEHIFFKCLTCSNNLCTLCKSIHDKNHKIIEYDQINYICQQHNDVFVKYCKVCKKNICVACDKEHINHDTIYFGDLMPNIDKIKTKLLEVKSVVEVFNKKIKNIIKQLDELAKSMDAYYEIQNDILNNYELKNKNYNKLYNLNQISINDELLIEMKNINTIQNINKQISNLIDFSNKIKLNNEKIKIDIKEESFEKQNSMKINNDKKEQELNYEKEKQSFEKQNSRKINNDRKEQKINYEEEKSEKEKLKEIESSDNKEEGKSHKKKLNKITIMYKIEKEVEKIQIFGDNFVKNNKNNCYLLIEGKQRELCSELILKNMKTEQKKIICKLN